MRRSWLPLALACHLLLALGYAIATPAAEGPDENSHYDYAWQIANAGRLPLPAAVAAARGLPQSEGAVLAHHPPLYHALLAAVLAASGRDDTVMAPLPNRTFGDPTAPGRWLHWLHGSGQGEGLLRLLRGVSVLLGLCTVALVHRLGRAACPAEPRIADLAALLTACLPMHSFLHGVLNNDVLAVTLCTAALLAMVRLVQAPAVGARGGAVLGALLGLALLTKATTLFLLPLAAVSLAVAGRRIAVARAAVAAAIAVVAVGGWWFVRNLTLGVDLLGLAAHDASFAPIPPELRARWLLHRYLPEVFPSLLGRFGWFALPLPAALAWTGAAVALLAAAGLLRSLRAAERATAPRPLWLLLAAPLLVFAGTTWFNWTAPQPQGRLLLPAIGPGAVLVAAGLVRATAHWRGRRWLAALLPLAGAAVLLAWFMPAFARGLAPAPAWHRTLVGAITAMPASSIPWAQLPPDAPLDAPPTLRWVDADAPADARYSLYVFDDGGRVWLASHEWTGGAFVVAGDTLTLPEQGWVMLPRGVRLWCKLRRLPAAPDDDPAALPATFPLPLTRR